ncbi:MAG: 4-oxalomesaconate tautomerase [Rhodobiaceae bacterium]|nr:4-oxalomesaconate tautomerase [Rhodobiaceae bacterium]
MSGQVAIPCMLMRGGTSKGAYFLAADLPADRPARDALLLAILGSPDPRQIDGIGGAHPLTSKVAVISPSRQPGCDVDYLFLQIVPDRDIVSDTQNCGNILAGVGPFAIERGLVAPAGDVTTVSVYMVNSQSRADLAVETLGGRVNYAGTARIDGVPGSHAPVVQNYFDTAGSMCGALLPSGQASDVFDGIVCTLIDNGMPSVVMAARDFGLSGYESPQELEDNKDLRKRLETIRHAAGPVMNLGDVSDKTVPKMCLVAPPRHGGIISTRTFIPHSVHQSVGVLGAATAAVACLLEGTAAHDLANVPPGNPLRCEVEHPTGALAVEIDMGQDGEVRRTGIIRTARKLFDGTAFALAGGPWG